MSFRVLPNGDIETTTAAEAIALAALRTAKEEPKHIGHKWCVLCDQPNLTGTCVGAGDGSGTGDDGRFAHKDCYDKAYPRVLEEMSHCASCRQRRPQDECTCSCPRCCSHPMLTWTRESELVEVLTPVKAAEEAKARVLAGTWDPPSGTWYFHCACPNIRRENSGIVASIRGARCARCGVCADRPAHPEAITATLIGSGETDESSLATAIQREIVQTLSTLPKRAWDGGEAPQPAASTPIAFVATIEQRPPGKNVSLDPKVVDSGFSSSTDLPTTAATMATIVSLTRVDGDYFPSKNYSLYVENPIGVRHAHLAPFSDYDEGCKGCLGPEGHRGAKGSAGRKAARSHDTPPPTTKIRPTIAANDPLWTTGCS